MLLLCSMGIIIVSVQEMLTAVGITIIQEQGVVLQGRHSLAFSPGLCCGGDCVCGGILSAGDAASAQVGKTFQVWHER